MKDAEDYQELLFCLERLGSYLLGRQSALGGYQDVVVALAELSPFAQTLPRHWRAYHTPAPLLYDLVRVRRNDALHQGTFARHLTARAVELSLVIENALEAYVKPCLGDYMVREPITAELWQPLSFVRQMMLTNSFSYLPLCDTRSGEGAWALLSDVAVARYVRTNGETKVSGKRLSSTVEEALEDGLEIVAAETSSEDEPVTKVFTRGASQPVLVVDTSNHLLGLVTPFDVL